MKFFDDIRIGDRESFGSHTFAAEEIKTFAARFDPQPFHLDEAAARKGMFGGIVGSGWHSVCLCMRMTVDAVFNHSSNMGSPGVEKIRFIRPLFPGDTISARIEVLDSVPSRSKPDRGRLTFGFTLTNQNNETIMDLQGMTIFGRRPSSDPAPNTP
jgi:acyl dehydratase